MGRALIAAARAGRDPDHPAGHLLPGRRAGPRRRPQPLAGPQLRFGDGDGEAWAARAEALGADEHGLLGPLARAGAAIHSVRAVPLGPDAPGRSPGRSGTARRCTRTCPSSARRTRPAWPPTAAPRPRCSTTPARSGPRATAVHATHLVGRDIDLLGGSRTFACLCPTTEADLADGIGPARELAAAGCPLTLGSDSQAVIDLFEEARRVELGERLASGQRGHFTRRRAGPGGHHRRARQPRLAGRRGDRRGRDRRPGHGRAGLAPAGRGTRQPRWRRSSSPRPPPTSATWWWAATTWCGDGRHLLMTTSRPRCPPPSRRSSLAGHGAPTSGLAHPTGGTT